MRRWNSRAGHGPIDSQGGKMFKPAEPRPGKSLTQKPDRVDHKRSLQSGPGLATHDSLLSEPHAIPGIPTEWRPFAGPSPLAQHTIQDVAEHRPIGNPNGIPSQSPGLRGTSYPGYKPNQGGQPRRGCVEGHATIVVRGVSAPRVFDQRPAPLFEGESAA